MSNANKIDINKLVLKAHKRGVKKAIEASVLSGIALVIYENGKIKSVKPKFKYVLVPIEPLKKNRSRIKRHPKSRPPKL